MDELVYCSRIECSQQNPQPRENFQKQAAKLNGLQSYCRACFAALEKKRPTHSATVYKSDPEKARKAHLWSTYRLRVADYNALNQSQGSVCAICGSPESTRLNLAVDHIKTTRIICGLLCNTCNRAIGLLRHDVNILKAAIKYVERRNKLNGYKRNT